MSPDLPDYATPTRSLAAPEALTADHQNAPAVRWGGGAIAVCALTFIATIVLYVVAYGPPDGTGVGGDVTPADKAAHMLGSWELISTLWVVEGIAWMLLAAAAFVLKDRAPAGPAWFPSRVAWTVTGVGALVQVVMYAFTLGAYPAAAAAVDAFPVLLSALEGAATYLFHAGNAFLYLGLGGALLAEASPAGVIPGWVARAGAAVCFVTAVLFVGLLAGVGEMMFAAPGALIGYLAGACLGARIWTQG